MKETIISELNDVEGQHNIEIISARLRGSRAKGVASEDSDYDIAFVFRQEPVVYATKTRRVDNIHDPHRRDGTIDLHGWNIDKFSDMCNRSDPNAVEYCTLTEEYISDDLDDLCEYVKENVSQIDLYNHYISMAKGNYQRYVENGDGSSARKFNILDAIARAEYVRTYASPPPIDVGLLASSVTDKLAYTVRSLAFTKMGIVEPTIDDRVDDLLVYEERCGNRDDLRQVDGMSDIDPDPEQTGTMKRRDIDSFVTTILS